MEIIPNLWQVGGTGLTAMEDAAIYLVRCGNQAFLVDAGCGYGHKKLVGHINEVLPPTVKITTLILTHCHFDHTGGADALRREFGCEIVAHELDAVFLEKGDDTVTAAAWYGAQMSPVSVDVKISGGHQVREIGNSKISLYHCPGHSPGSMVCLVNLAGQRVLFAQDVHGPLDPTLLSNRQDYRQSLRMIRDLDADLLCEGHFGVYRGKESVRKFIKSYL